MIKRKGLFIMAYCRSCGAEIDDDVKFCPACGKPTGVEEKQGFDVSGATKAAEDKFKEVTNTKDHTGEYDPADIEQNKIISLFSYLGILILVPIFGAKNSPFALFHVNQGLAFIIANAVFNIVFGLLDYLFANVTVLGPLVALLSAIGNIILLALVILGIYNAVNGKAKDLPIIGTWTILPPKD